MEGRIRNAREERAVIEARRGNPSGSTVRRRYFKQREQDLNTYVAHCLHLHLHLDLRYLTKPVYSQYLHENLIVLWLLVEPTFGSNINSSS